jgi:two-component system sensor histidine kinase RegB
MRGVTVAEAASLGTPAERALSRPAQVTATRAHLARIFWARNIVLAALCVAAAYGALRHDGPSFGPWGTTLLALAGVVNFSAWLRLRQPAPVAYGEFLLQILADVVLIAAALHHSGGHASPLGDLSYVPLVVAAATLPGAQVIVVFVAIAALDELVCNYLPAFAYTGGDDQRVEILVEAILASFVYAMARTSRTHEAALARLREEEFAERQAAELGAVAGLAVHELGSPLATMAVVVEDVQLDVGKSSPLAPALGVLAAQIEECKRICSWLMAAVGHERAGGGRRLSADRFVVGVAERCSVMHPWVALELRAESGGAAPHILADDAIEHAILVLLQCPPGRLRRLELAHRWDESYLYLQFRERDEPPRPPDARRAMLARGTIQRFGGAVRDTRHADGRSCMEIQLALFPST